MRSFVIRTVGLLGAAVLLAAAGPGLPGDAPKGDVHGELKKLQSLWQNVPGGMQHQDSAQVVRGPARDGPRFFIHGDKLIWLDKAVQQFKVIEEVVAARVERAVATQADLLEARAARLQAEIDLLLETADHK